MSIYIYIYIYISVCVRMTVQNAGLNGPQIQKDEPAGGSNNSIAGHASANSDEDAKSSGKKHKQQYRSSGSSGSNGTATAAVAIATRLQKKRYSIGIWTMETQGGAEGGSILLSY